MNVNQRSVDVPGLAHNAPIPLGARISNLVCSSAIAGKDPVAGILSKDPAEQVRQAFCNLRLFLDAAGAGLSDVIKMTIYLRDNGLRDAINEQWNVCFPNPKDRPARHILNYDLQHGMLIQLEVMAVIQTSAK